MSRSWTSIEAAVKTRHYVRAILRECSYLPDPQARQYIGHYALDRFRRNNSRAQDPQHKIVFQGRLNDKFKEAQSAVNLLRRANAGDRGPLLRVLLMAYGRIGRHRRELLQLVLRAKPAGHGERQVKADLAQLPPLLHALAQSQIRTAPPNDTGPNPRTLRPHIPELNSYLRPTPQCRVQNLTSRWYAALLDRILPPLSTTTWERLYRLAQGQVIPSILPVPRRKKASRQATHSTERKLLEFVVARGKVDATKVFSSRDAHRITPRFMQRLWAQVFRHCPRMDWDAEKDIWNVTWGGQALQSQRLPQPAASILTEGLRITPSDVPRERPVKNTSPPT